MWRFSLASDKFSSKTDYHDDFVPFNHDGLPSPNHCFRRGDQIRLQILKPDLLSWCSKGKIERGVTEFTKDIFLCRRTQREKNVPIWVFVERDVRNMNLFCSSQHSLSHRINPIPNIHQIPIQLQVGSVWYNFLFILILQLLHESLKYNVS